MHVSLGRVRYFIVDDVGDAIDVEPTRRDVGRDQDRIRARPESFDCRHALLLCAIGVQRGRSDAHPTESTGQPFRANLGAAEDQHWAGCLITQPAGKPLRLLAGGNGLHVVRDRLGRTAAPSHLHVLRFVQKLLRQP